MAAWLKSAKPGDTITYHTGNLAYDRCVEHFADERRAEVVALNTTAGAFLAASKSGDALLTQRRVCEGTCEYRAVKLTPAARSRLQRLEAVPIEKFFPGLDASKRKIPAE